MVLLGVVILPNVLRTKNERQVAILRLIAKLLAASYLLSGIAHAQTYPLYVNSGGAGFFNGTNWIADAYYSGGSTDSTSSVIFNAGTAKSLFATRRVGDTFSYTFPNVPTGTYEIDLYFADWEAAAPGQRKFDVRVNGAAALTAFDIYVAAGNQGYSGYIRHIQNVPVAGGSLSIAFAKNGGALPAQINGIAITQTGSLPTTTLTGCQTTLTPGNYVLASDLQVPSGYPSACFFFYNTGANTATALDCQGHSITNLSTTIANTVTADTVPNFSLLNCTINVAASGNSGVQVLRSPQSTLLNNTINNTFVFIGDSNNVTLSKNTLSGGGLVLLPIQQSQILGTTIDSNTIDIRSVTQLSSGILASGLANSTITNNKVYGSKPYTDDDIVLTNASGVTIQGNTLVGAIDVGVEFVGSNDHIQVLGNNMDSVSRGIGGWYDLSMTNSVIDGNAVTNATLFDFNYAHSHTDPNTYTVTFAGNRISNNRVSEGCSGSCAGPSAFFEFTEDLATNPVQSLPHTLIANNVLANNNFDLNAYGPYLNPPTGFIDGGGNICSTSGIFPVTGYPIQCGTSTSCTSPASGQFRACYWANESWSGTEAVNRLDAYPLSFNWGGGSPACSANLPDLGYNCPSNMSASWTGNFQFNAGYYIFTPRAGGGTITVSIDGVPVASRSYSLLPSYSSPFLPLLSAGTHTIRVTYTSNGFAGFADAELSWRKF